METKKTMDAAGAASAAEWKTKKLRSPDLLPVKDEDRKLSLADYTLLWAGMTINVLAFSIGSQYYNGGEGLSIGTLAAVVFLGYLVVTALTVMTGDIGTKYGIPFTVYIRAAFGYNGSKIAGILRAFPCVYWFGFQTWVGACALNVIIGMLVPGFDQVTVLIIVFGAVQIINALFGLGAMAKFDVIAVPCLAAMFALILVSTCSQFGVTIPDILAIHAKGNYSFAFAVAGITGGWITMSLNGSDLTRQIKRRENCESIGFFRRNDRAILGQIIGLMVVGILAMMIGFIAGVYTGQWDLNAAIMLLYGNKPLLLVFCTICVIFAQWSTNTAANLMPPTYILINIIPTLKFWMATIIAGVIGILLMPWKQQGGDFLIVAQANFALLLGPVIGIMLADYYLIRKGKLNVHDLYTSGGQYRYTGGFNLSAIAAMLIAFALAYNGGDYSFYIALVLSVILYIVFMKLFTLKKHQQHIGEIKYFDETKMEAAYGNLD